MDGTGAFTNFMQEVGMKFALDSMTTEYNKDEEMDAALKEAILTKFKEGMNEQMEENKKQVAEQLEDYKANKEERDAKAFALVDTTGEGTLSKTEFMEAFTFGTEKNEKVMEALG